MICLNRPVSAILRGCSRRGGPNRPAVAVLRLAEWNAAAGKSLKRAQLKIRNTERKRITVVMIRLARVGARKQPYYRIVVIEKDRARNGRSVEVVGTYNPRTSPATVDLKHERIAYWRSKGATLSPTMEKLVKQNPVPVTAEAASGPAAA
jgi:small subunit ribosomal protein S16